MEDSSKKHKRPLSSSKFKIIFILIVISFLVLAGLTPTFNSILINDDEAFTKDNKGNDEEIKGTSMDDDDVWAIASFYWTPIYPDPGEEVTFHSTSYAHNGVTSTPTWKFHDGETVRGTKTTKTYENKGSYKVTLSVHASSFHGSDSDITTHYVPIGADPFPKIKCIPENPSPGEKVKLDGSDSSDPDGRIISYKWSYYNTKSPENVTNLGSDVTVYHTWSKQGTYIVSLFTEDDKGNNNTLELTIVVSILKLIFTDTSAREISFRIGNYGDVTAKNIKWNVEIFKEGLIKSRSKSLYKKSGNFLFLTPQASQVIDLKDIRRRLCRIKLVVSAEADNAVKVSKTFYGRIIGKFIFLKEEKIETSSIDIFRFIILFGWGFTFLFVLFNALTFNIFNILMEIIFFLF